MKYITANLLNRLWKNGVLPALGKKMNKNDAGGIASCGGDGKYSYFKIATIKITATYVNRPIVFELSGRGRLLSLLTVRFSSVNNVDPGLEVFTTNNDNVFWIKKTATSTWEIYGQYNELYGSYTLHRVTGTGADIGVSVNMGNISSLPTGCTQAGYGGNVNYANSAGKVNGHTVNADVPSGAKFTDTVYTHPTSSGNKHIPSGGSSGQILRWSADGTAAWGNDNNTTYGVATTSANGLMSKDMVTKLNGIASGANKTNVANNLTTTAAGYALDARQGKALDDKIVSLNNDLSSKLDKTLALPWVTINTLDSLNTGLTYVTLDSNSPETDNKFFYAIYLKHPTDSAYKKIIVTSAFSNNTYINTKNNGVWVGWRKI